MDGIVFDEMRSSGERASGVHLDHFDVIAPRGRDMAEGAAADAAKSVDANFDGHGAFLVMGRAIGGRMSGLRALYLG